MSARTLASRNAILALLLCACLPAQAEKRPALPCRVADFRSLALSLHDPATRAQQAEAWLKQHGSSCTREQVQAIADNRAAWMGTADSPAIMGLVDGLLEARAQGKGAAVTKTYSPAVPAPAPTAEIVSTPPARAPVEDARPAYGIVSGGMPPPANRNDGRPPDDTRSGR